MIRFIGDIHAEWNEYYQLIANCENTIQVGDFGIGLWGFPDGLLKLDGKHRFIRGNHDHPQLCQLHPWYLGDFGQLNNFGQFTGKIFFVGGAWTPPFYIKNEGINWWREEELEYAALEKAIDMAVETRPNIIVTHDCPTELKDNHIKKDRYIGKNGKRFENTRTDTALQVLFERYQPDYWIFGHYHERFDGRLNGTRFICLETFGVFDLYF